MNVLVVGAHNLFPKNIGDTLNAYAILRVSKLSEKTQTSQKSLNPTWNEQFTFKFVNSNDILTVEVYAASRWKAETSLGTATIPLYNFKDFCVRELRCPLEALGHKHTISAAAGGAGAPPAVSGDIHLIVQCTKLGAPLPDLSEACRSRARDLYPQVHFGAGQLALEVASYEDSVEAEGRQRSLCFRVVVDGVQEARSEISDAQRAEDSTEKKKKNKGKKGGAKDCSRITWGRTAKNKDKETEEDPEKNRDNSFYFDVTSTSTVELTFYELICGGNNNSNSNSNNITTVSSSSSSTGTLQPLSTSGTTGTPAPSGAASTMPLSSSGSGGTKAGWTVLGKATISITDLPVTTATKTKLELQLIPPEGYTAHGTVRMKVLYLPPFRVPGAQAQHALFFGCFTPQFNWAYGSQTKETWSGDHSSHSLPPAHRLVSTEGLAGPFHIEDSRGSVTAFWDEDTLADAFSAQENMRFYYHFVYDSPHTVFLGTGEASGPVVLVVAAPDSSGFRKIVLWTQDGERRLVALGTADCMDAIRAECPALAHTKFREARSGGGLRNAIRDYEASNTPSRFKVGVLYAGPGQRTEAALMANTHVSELFEQFLDVLGERVELCGWPHYDGGLDVGDSLADGRYSRYTTLQGIELMYHVPSYMPLRSNDAQQIARKRHVMNDTVVVVFKEPAGPDDVVDIASFQSHCTCVYFVVSPVVKDDTLFYAVNVVYKDDILPAPPFLPQDGDDDGPLLKHEKGLHAWIVKKIVNADKNTKISSVYSSMNVKSRSVVLSRIIENAQTK